MRMFILLYCIMVITQSHAPGTGTGSKISANDAAAALAFHNQARKEAGVPALQWSVQLAAYAQAWADHLADSACSFEHRPHSGKWEEIYGENLFWGSSDHYTVKDACESWYEEKKDFKNTLYTGKQTNQIGHYTQMIWRNTTQVGIGIATCKDGSIIIVANYDPPGNYLGENVY
jgi:pathogenesis-related protein 1